MAVANFFVIKSMMDDDIIDYLLNVRAWLTERLGPATTEFATQNSLGSTTKAEKWCIEANSIIGKFHTWSMHYSISIDDDTTAVEFALVKDTL